MRGSCYLCWYVRTMEYSWSGVRAITSNVREYCNKLLLSKNADALIDKYWLQRKKNFEKRKKKKREERKWWSSHCLSFSHVSEPHHHHISDLSFHIQNDLDNHLTSESVDVSENCSRLYSAGSFFCSLDSCLCSEAWLSRTV